MMAESASHEKPDAAIELLKEAREYDPDDQTISNIIATLYIKMGDAILKENNSLLGITGSFFKIKQLKSPESYFKEAYAFDSKIEGAHIQWLIKDLEGKKDFTGALELYKEASKLHPNFNYKLISCHEQALFNKRNDNLQGAYELFLLAHKFESNNFKIKEELVSTGFKLAKSCQENEPITALKYYQEILPFVREIKTDSDLSFGHHAPLPEVIEGDVNKGISEIYYNHAMQLVDQCRHSSIASRDFELFEQNKNEHQEQIMKAVGWLQEALKVNPESAKAHFDLANFVDYFEVENVDPEKHFKKAVDFNPNNYFYKFRLAEIESLHGNKVMVEKLRERVTTGYFWNEENYPEGASQDFIKWFDNRYLIKEERFATVNPHFMCRK